MQCPECNGKGTAVVETATGEAECPYLGCGACGGTGEQPLHPKAEQLVAELDNAWREIEDHGNSFMLEEISRALWEAQRVGFDAGVTEATSERDRLRKRVAELEATSVPIDEYVEIERQLAEQREWQRCAADIEAECDRLRGVLHQIERCGADSDQCAGIARAALKGGG